MDYYHILVSSDDLIKLQKVCSEFYQTLQGRGFWKEKSDQDRIEPGLSNMREWIIHRRALLASMIDIPKDGLEIKIERNSVCQTLLDKERERGHPIPLQVADIESIIFRLRGRHRHESVLFIILIHHQAEYNVRYKRLNLEERRSLVYQSNRGTYMNII
ncbi:Hypothetical protein BQ3484_22 [Cedratvirus A11]|uniref:Uncharacterized protein n=1 Tax=Cedratvirus A11 TaxID=1903266 RepID=A0A1M7XU63_9VIRU|nr:Hypothetical protein BQ3484_22 [Cedratvirus A11]SHO33090.1 Hypothetical protein BQ3484_22 [Cedratvirus A11]